LFFSLAFLFQTPEQFKTPLRSSRKTTRSFVMGFLITRSKGLDGRVKTSGIDVQKPDGSISVLRPEALVKNVPEPFKSEPTGGGGTRNASQVCRDTTSTKPTARVYMGSYNFSVAADSSNGGELVVH
jgi:hypothetical protein